MTANILLPLQGGLGNQLFQLAATRHTRCRVTFTIDWYRKNSKSRKEHNYERRLILPLVTKNIPKYKYVSCGAVLDRVIQTIEDNALLNSCGLKITSENSNERLSIPRNGFKIVLLRGFFINTFLQTVKADPADEVHFSNWRDFGALSFQTREKLYSDDAALHLRLGDYRQNSQFQVLKKVFLAESISQVCKRLEFRSLNVFTDSLHDSKNLLHSVLGIRRMKDVRFHSGEEVDDFLSLAAHPIIICSDSTYSWWASVIGRKKHLVIRPASSTFMDESVLRYSTAKETVLITNE